MNCSTVIAKYLQEAGIGHVFGYPGDPNVEVIEALRREGLEFVLARRYLPTRSSAPTWARTSCWSARVGRRICRVAW